MAVVSCPFYAHEMGWSDGSGMVHIVPNPGSNRCALITSAQSPCWMEVGEQRSPDWEECLRNPEVAAAVVGIDTRGVTRAALMSLLAEEYTLRVCAWLESRFPEECARLEREVTAEACNADPR